MTPREKLQLSYEIAFFPPRLNQLWGTWAKNHTGPDADTGDALDIALMLHLKLPESGYNSMRALTRVAIYQAKSRAFGIPAFIRAVRHHFGRPPINVTEIPGEYIRDFALPAFGRNSPVNRTHSGISGQ
ncbi:MAG: hypothetical protein WCI51_22855 [Lentisphaerota bacterium]